MRIYGRNDQVPDDKHLLPWPSDISMNTWMCIVRILVKFIGVQTSDIFWFFIETILSDTISQICAERSVKNKQLAIFAEVCDLCRTCQSSNLYCPARSYSGSHRGVCPRSWTTSGLGLPIPNAREYRARRDDLPCSGLCCSGESSASYEPISVCSQIYW